MWLTRVAVYRPLFMTMAFLAVVVFGIISYTRLGVELLPAVNFPVVTVVTTYPGASPSSVESLVTVPIEDALSGLSELSYVSSTSVEGVSTVTLVFTEKTNIDVSAIDVERKVNSIRASLPVDARPPSIVKADINALPVMNLALSGPIPVGELTQIAEDRVVPALNGVGGVASVSVVGGQKREIQVRVNPERLRAYGLSILQVNTALAQENVNVPSGQVTEGARDLNVRLDALALAPTQLGGIALTSGTGGSVYVRDVASVVDTTVKRTQINRSNGQDSIGLLITKQSTANTIAVADAVKKRLAELDPTMPQGVRLEVVTDASVFTRQSLEGVQRELIEAVLLVGLVLLLFLHALRSTFIVLLAIPTSLVATFLAMSVLGFTLNTMSLLALTLTIGILVDDSIVVLENIFRHLELGETPLTAAIAGRSEIGLAAIAITLVDVVVFTPVALVSGITGQFFREFGLVIVAATLFSLLVSFTLTPMLASRWLRAPSSYDRSPLAVFGRRWERGFASLGRSYRHLLALSLRHRWAVVAVGVASFGAGIALVAANVVGSEFIPETDQSQFNVIVEMPPGTTLDATARATSEVERRLSLWPEVQNTFTSVGVAGGNRPQQARFARMTVKLVPIEERSVSSVELAARAREFSADIPDLKLRTELPSIGGPGGQAIQIQIRGEDFDQLNALAGQVEAIASSVPGTRDVAVSVQEGQPEVVLRLDRNRAADLGVSATQVATALRTVVAGNVVTQYRPEGEKGVDVRVLVENGNLPGASEITLLPLLTSRGTTVQLGQVASVERSPGSSQIDRRDRQRLITVTGDVTGRAQGDVVADIQKRLNGLAIPPGYSARFVGVAQEQQESFAQLYLALGLSVLLTYMVTVALYESLLIPFVILLSLPLAVAGAIGALALTGSRLNLLSLIGFIMLVGLVGKNAILLLDYTNTLRKRGMERYEALLEAGRTRLRPILMTTVSLVIALMPVALGVAEGSEIRRPIAIPVIGGMFSSTLLTLVFVPVAYTLADDLRMWLGRVFSRSRVPASRENVPEQQVGAMAPVPARRSEHRPPASDS